MSTSIPAVSLNAASQEAGDTIESLGALLLATLPPLRLHSLSVFDAGGDVLWLSEGSLGPDEQAFAEDALRALDAARTRAHLENALADGRGAVFLAVRTPHAALVAVVMVLVETKALSSGNLAARILTSSMRAVLQRLAMLVQPPAAQSGLRPVPVVGDTGTATATMSVAPDDSVLEWTPQSLPAQTATERDVLNLLAPEEARELALDRKFDAALDADPAWAAAVVSAPAATSTSAPVPTPAATPTLTPAPAAAVSVPAAACALQLRELVRLRPGGRMRRFRVATADAQLHGNPLATLTALLDWLQQHPGVLQGDPLSLAIEVPEQALADQQLPARLIAALAAAHVAPEMIGFELHEAACIRQRAAAERFLVKCEQSGCFVVLEDFTFDSAVLDLLRSSAVRVLKVQTGLVATALRDKLAQARITAIAQAAKVLGMHCAAPRTDSQSGRRWLCAVGFDFAQAADSEPLQKLLQA